MEKTRILIIGLGSIGRRHAVLLRDEFSCEVIALREHRENAGALEGVREVYSWEEASALKPAAAFIANPTSLHIATALRCARENWPLFIEKPVGSSTDGLDELLAEVRARDLPTYVAYNLRFLPAIKWLKGFLRDKKVYHASLYNSSFLPEWRPGTDHAKSYSSRRELGGGALLDISHEFDLAYYLLGAPGPIAGTCTRRSDVTVDAEDCVDAIMCCGDVPVNVHLNFLSRHRERSLKLDTDAGFVSVDLVEGKAEGTGADGAFSRAFDTGVKESYRDQIAYFLKNIGNPIMMNNLNEAEPLFRRLTAFKAECHL